MIVITELWPKAAPADSIRKKLGNPWIVALLYVSGNFSSHSLFKHIPSLPTTILKKNGQKKKTINIFPY